MIEMLEQTYHQQHYSEPEPPSQPDPEAITYRPTKHRYPNDATECDWLGVELAVSGIEEGERP
jgi:hypothetical protein